MKIALFAPTLHSGGAQQVAILLASSLMKAGHEVIVITPLNGGELAGRLDGNCRAFQLGVPRPLRATKRLADLIFQERPNAIICFGIYTGIAAAISKYRFDWKAHLLIRNENNLAEDWRQASILNRIVGPTLSRWAARRAHVIAVSKALASATEDFLRVKTGSVTPILNPVLHQRQTELPPREEQLAVHPWLIDNGDPVFVAIGRLEHQKGFDVLIEAFAKVRKGSSARLIIFGEGSLRDTLIHRISLAELDSSVSLAGFTDYPIDQLKAAHAFVLSSRYEGFGLVLVEALWAGAKVVSTDCKYGPAEILENGRYGALVPVADSSALAAAMTATLRSDHHFERPAEEWFLKFTAEEAARQHAELIESLNQG